MAISYLILLTYLGLLNVFANRRLHSAEVNARETWLTFKLHVRSDVSPKLRRHRGRPFVET